MDNLLNSYNNLDPLSSRSAVTDVLNKIIIAPPTAITPSTRASLIHALLQDIATAGPQSRITDKDAARALLAVKSLGKDPSGSKVLASDANLSLLLGFVSTFADDVNAANEALRCIANCLLLVEEARESILEEPVRGGEICLNLLEKTTSPDRIFILCRILFLAISSGSPHLQTLVETEYNGRGIVDIIASKLDLVSPLVLDGVALSTEAATDLLKFTVHLLLAYPKLVQSHPQTSTIDDDKVMISFWNSNLDGILAPLLRLYMTLPLPSPCTISSPLSNAISVLLAIPINDTLRPIWLNQPPQSSSDSASPTVGENTPYTGDLTERTYTLFDKSFEYYFPGSIDVDDSSIRDRIGPDDSLDQMLTPLAVLLSRLCLADADMKTRVREWIIPHDMDRSSPLEQKDNILGRCLRLLACVYHPNLKIVVGDLLYTLADRDASTLSSLVGYGNVAGFLNDQGVLGGIPTSSKADSAPATTPDGQEINPITGTTVQPKSDIPEMSEEEKEREMDKLLVLFDRMEKLGALTPDQNPIRRAIQEGKIQ